MAVVANDPRAAAVRTGRLRQPRRGPAVRRTPPWPTTATMRSSMVGNETAFGRSGLDLEPVRWCEKRGQAWRCSMCWLVGRALLDLGELGLGAAGCGKARGAGVHLLSGGVHVWVAGVVDCSSDFVRDAVVNRAVVCAPDEAWLLRWLLMSAYAGEGAAQASPDPERLAFWAEGLGLSCDSDGDGNAGAGGTVLSAACSSAAMASSMSSTGIVPGSAATATFELRRRRSPLFRLGGTATRSASTAVASRAHPRRLGRCLRAGTWSRSAGPPTSLASGRSCWLMKMGRNCRRFGELG